MYRVRLIHWNAVEAEERCSLLRSAGFDVAYEPVTPAGLRALRQDPPSAIAIDLSRSPSQGRDLALQFRKHGATRHVPLLFLEGAPEKVAPIKDLLPDATYTTWAEIQCALEFAIAHPLEEPVVHESTFAAYAGTPLSKKLGIKAGSVVALVGAPEGFEATLGELPPGVELRREDPDPNGVTLWFVRSRQELENEIGRMGAFAAGGGLWIVWPKKASGVVSDVAQPVVREVGLASGLVDFKISSIDPTWSGLRFSQRK